MRFFALSRPLRVGISLPQISTNAYIPRKSLLSHNNTICSLAAEPSGKKHIISRTPYDLVHFRRSKFVAQLDELRRRGALPEQAALDEPSQLDKALQDAGIAHEKNVVDRLVSIVKNNSSDPIVTIPRKHPERFELTRQAIRDQVPLIQGAALQSPCHRLSGYADLLILSCTDPFLSSTQCSRSDPKSYSVCEVKFSSTQSSDHVLQLATYSAMLSKLLTSDGIQPSSYAYLWLGNPNSPPERLETRTLTYIFNEAWKEYKEFLQRFRVEDPIQMPDAPESALSPWRTYARNLLEETDSLQLIAGISRAQMNQISEATGTTTLTDFANMTCKSIDHQIRNGKLGTAHSNLHKQAQLQLLRRKVNKPVFEIKNDMYLKQAFPEPSTSDIFFDLEGYPFMPDGGLEYLFGASHGSESFKYWFGHDRLEEERSFIAFINWVESLLIKAEELGDVIPHIYHYGHYEVSALKRIARRVSTREGHQAVRVLESFLEDKVFFDIYKFVKSTLKIGESNYSIKSVEKLLNVSRENDELADAESSVGMYYDWRKNYYENCDDNHQQQQGSASHPILDEILHYNRQDCESLQGVVDWLRAVVPSVPKLSDVSSEASIENEEEEQQEPQKQYLPGACGRTNDLKAIDSASISRCNELSDELLTSKISTVTDETAKTLSHFLQFHVRESAPVRRSFRERVSMATTSDSEMLFSIDKCIAGAILSGSIQSEDGKKTFFVYRFPLSQPLSIAEGESVALVTTKLVLGTYDEDGDISCFMTVKRYENAETASYRSVVLSSGKRKVQPPRRATLISTDDLQVCDGPLRQSLQRKSEELVKSVDGALHTLSTTFLCRTPFYEKCNEVEQSDRAYLNQDSSKHYAKQLVEKNSSFIFIIQGPPGSGKTRLSAGIIYELISRFQKTVAVTSNSHAAIDNLLRATVQMGLDPSVICKVGTRLTDEIIKIPYKAKVEDLKVTAYPNSNDEDSVEERYSSPKTCRRRRSKSSTTALVGATCYQLCKEENTGKFDFLFVDEASQVTAANFMAQASCAKAAVLVGDQQQLEMPIRGAHPEDAGLSCLSYSVGADTAIVPANRGIFLGRSYRMNSKLCNFISSTFYDNALQAAEMCERNSIRIPADAKDNLVKTRCGLVFIGCDDVVPEENDVDKGQYGKWHRPEEVTIIRRIISELIGKDATVKNESKKLRCEDIMVVAPYNAQVRALQANLPEGVRVGTVDKFQGQEAPVSIVSTCTGLHDESELPTDVYSEDTRIPVTSSNETEPEYGSNHKGVKFALQKNRLNVAISRAQCLAVVVGSEDTFAGLTTKSYQDADICSLYELIKAEGKGDGTAVKDEVLF